MEYPKFKVCCRCFTFNQAKYITDTMNGFTMQQTSFPFVCTIVDDASTDGEQELIRKYVEEHFDLSEEGVSYKKETEYAHIIYAQHKTNMFCYFAVLLLKENHYSQKKNKMPYLKEWRDDVEYEALCEGDDYWIANDKLQRQFDELDKKPNATMVYSNYQTVDEKGNPILRPQYEDLKKLSFSGDNLPNLFKKNYPLTCTVMIKMSIYSDDLYLNSPHGLDYALFVTAAFRGDFVYMNDITSCYRQNPNSLMNSKYDVIVSSYSQMTNYFTECFLSDKAKKQEINNIRSIKHTISNRLIDRRDILYLFHLFTLSPSILLYFIYNGIKRIIKKIG